MTTWTSSPSPLLQITDGYTHQYRVLNASFSSSHFYSSSFENKAVDAHFGWPTVLLILIMGIISVLTIVGNLVVLLSYYLDKTIRQPANYFIFSLAVSDLLIGLEGIPVYTYFFINDNRWPFGDFVCDLWLSIDYSCCLASIYTVLGITIDRYCSVKYPAAYRNWRTQARVMIIIAATWIIPSLLFSFSIFGYSLFSGRGRILKADECYVQFMTNAYLNMGMYIAYYWSTLALMLYLYYGIYTAAKQLAKKSDQKQKRLDLLSEMRHRASKKEAASTLGGASEAAISNSALESHSSDSTFQRNNNRMNNNSTTVTAIENTARASVQQQKRDTVVKELEDDDDEKSDEKSAEKTRSIAEMEVPSVPIVILPPETEIIPGVKEEIAIVEEPPIVEVLVAAADEGAFQVNDEFGDGSNTSRIAAIEAEVPKETIISLEEEEENSVSLTTIVTTECNNNDDTSTDGIVIIVADNNNTTGVADYNANSSTRNSNNNHHPPSNRTTANERNNDNESNALVKKYKVDRPEIPDDDLQEPSQFDTLISQQNTNIHIERTSNGGSIGVRRLLTVIRQQQLSRKRSGTTNTVTTSNFKGKKKRKDTKSAHSRSENRARKALRTITVILGTFTVFWTPFYVLATIYGFCERCSASPNFNTLYAISYYLCYMNSPINPLCYALANQQFKRTFKRILKGDLRRT